MGVARNQSMADRRGFRLSFVLHPVRRPPRGRLGRGSMDRGCPALRVGSKTTVTAYVTLNGQPVSTATDGVTVDFAASRSSGASIPNCLSTPSATLADGTGQTPFTAPDLGYYEQVFFTASVEVGGQPVAGAMSICYIYVYNVGTPTNVVASYDAPSDSMHASWTSDGQSLYAYGIMGVSDSSWMGPWNNGSSNQATLSLAGMPLIQAGKTYRVYVQAVSPDDYAWSQYGYSNNVVIDTTPPSTVYVTRNGPDFVTSATSLGASWTTSQDPESGIARYECAISRSPTANPADLVTGFQSVGLNTSATLTNLTLANGQAYYFIVKAVNGAGLTSISSSAPAYVDSRSLPGITLAVYDDGAYTLNTNELHATFAVWSDAAMDTVSDASNNSRPESWYAIGTTPGGTDVAPWTWTTGYLYTIAPVSLTPGVTYYISIKARSSSGGTTYEGSACSAGITATTDPTVTNPTSPTALALTNANATGSLSLQWSYPSSAVDGFYVERRMSYSEPYSRIATLPASARTFTDPHVFLQWSYYYRVCAFKNGVKSAYSNVLPVDPQLTATDVQNLAPSELFAFAISPSQVVLTWNRCNLLVDTGTLVERSDDGGKTWNAVEPMRPDGYNASTKSMSWTWWDSGNMWEYYIDDNYGDTQHFAPALRPSSTYEYRISLATGIGGQTAYTNVSLRPVVKVTTPPGPAGSTLLQNLNPHPRLLATEARLQAIRANVLNANPVPASWQTAAAWYGALKSYADGLLSTPVLDYATSPDYESTGESCFVRMFALCTMHRLYDNNNPAPSTPVYLQRAKDELLAAASTNPPPYGGSWDSTRRHWTGMESRRCRHRLRLALRSTDKR